MIPVLVYCVREEVIMGSGSHLKEVQILTWKNKSRQKEEAEEYEQWAFPYGEKQREALTKLLLEVFPKGSPATTLVPFLTCKELFEDVCRTPDLRDYAVERLVCGIKKYKLIIRKNEMPVYVALVLADSVINEECRYPAAEDILTKAAQLEKLREDAKHIN
jgi:hypothetical protein